MKNISWYQNRILDIKTSNFDIKTQFFFSYIYHIYIFDIKKFKIIFDIKKNLYEMYSKWRPIYLGDSVLISLHFISDARQGAKEF